MIRAIFSFSTLAGTDGRFEVDALATVGDNVPAILLTYKCSSSAEGPSTVLHVGQLTGYAPWSEAPLALMLRALFFWRTQWYWNIPAELLEGTVRRLDVSVKLLGEDENSCVELAALSLTQSHEVEGQYAMAQSLPDNMHGDLLHLRHWTSFPLSVAFSALAKSQSQLTYVDLQRWPDALKPAQLTDEIGRRFVLRDQVPAYALRAFDARRPNLRLLNASDSAALIPAAAWQNFLTA